MEPGPDLLVLPVLQMVDQLAEVVVDVPNIVSQSEFQLRTVEQFVNIPIPDSNSGFGLHGFLQDRVQQRVRSRSLTFKLLVEVFKVLPQHRDSTASCRGSRVAVPGGSPQNFVPGQSFTAFYGTET